jgi:pimeloyl-ACP methyl ester carboxylesterase
MKKYILFCVVLFVAHELKAQSGIIGIWEGKMNPGVELRMIFHFYKDEKNQVAATMDCPDQGIKDVKASSFKIENDSVHLEFSQFHVTYSGKFIGDTIISGSFEQGTPLPLTFRKIKTIIEKKRPQTPVPPFPYITEDLLYQNADKSISYGATITIPQGKGPFPAVLLLTGSGQQNRDEEILGHKPFAVIADHLTRNGFIVLRVDDRGMGKTKGDVMSATTLDFAKDAAASLEYLKGRKEVDQSRIGLIGHSEGGMIAQILGAERNDLSFIIMLAGPGENNSKLMEDQNRAILTKAGLSEEYINSYLSLYRKFLSTILTSDQSSISNNLTKVVDDWIAATPNNIVKATTGIIDETTKMRFINQFRSQVDRPWFKYFLSYDPAVNLKKIRARFLALNGASDIQVISKVNLAAIEQALKQGQTASYEIKELPGLNHLFQECKSCTVAEYGQLEQTISPVVLQIITEWMKAIR